MTDDSTLLRRYAKEASEEAFSEIVRRHIDLIYASAYRQVGDRQRAEDVVQMVFSDLARKSTVLCERPVLLNWLYVSTHYAAANVIRLERRRRIREEEAETMHKQSIGPEDGADWQRLRPVLDQVMNELDDRDREAILLRFFKGLPFEAVGAALRVTDEAARKRVDRALEKLRGRLVGHGITSTGAALTMVLADQAVVAAPTGLAASVTSAVIGATSTAASSHVISMTTQKAIFTFMTTTKTITGIASVVALIAIAIAVHQASERHALEAALRSAAHDLDQTQVRLKNSEQNALVLRKEATDLRQEVVGLAARGPAGQSTPNARSGLSSASLDPRIDARKPEVRRRLLELSVLQTKADAQPFFNRRGIPAEKQDEILRQVFEPAFSKLDAVELAKAALAKGAWSREDDARLGKLTDESRVEAENKARLLLGDDGVQQFSQFLMTMGERSIANYLAGQVYFTATPMTTDTAETLVRVLSENRFSAGADNPQAKSMGGMTITAENVTLAKTLASQEGIPWLPLVTDSSLSNSSAVLSASQLTALQQLQNKQIALLRMTNIQTTQSSGGK